MISLMTPIFTKNKVWVGGMGADVYLSSIQNLLLDLQETVPYSQVMIIDKNGGIVSSPLSTFSWLFCPETPPPFCNGSMFLLDVQMTSFSPVSLLDSHTGIASLVSLFFFLRMFCLFYRFFVFLYHNGRMFFK